MFIVPVVSPELIVMVVDKSPDNVTVVVNSTAVFAVAVMVLCVAVTVIVIL